MSIATPDENRLDAAIVGAGFAGLYMLHRLRGLGFKSLVLEAGDGVGGTWYWNRYPGARCDVESMQYSYQFSGDLQQEWNWSERYAAQPELLRYANHVADRFDLRHDIRFGARVVSAVFDPAAQHWCIETADGAQVRARFCIMATGCLSSPNLPAFKGIDTFKGDKYHTGYWPHEEVDFTDKRVAVIGTGSSAVQSIPIIARQAQQLFVFQRTANYAVPAQNHDLDQNYQQTVKAEYPTLRARAKLTATGIDFDYSDRMALDTPANDRDREYETRWQRGGLSFLGAFMDIMVNEDANRTAADFVRGKIRETVRDPAVAELLSPTNTIGCKRLCIDIGYYETFNRPNVTLVDVSETPVQAITPNGVIVAGREYAVDAIVFATGFDAMTGALLKMDIRGRDGLTLREKWTAGPRMYLGLATAGLPQPVRDHRAGKPFSAHQYAAYHRAACRLDRAASGSHADASTSPPSSRHRKPRMPGSATATRSPDARSGYTCSSWYLGANVPGKPRVFMPYIGGFPKYVQKCNDVAANGYEGFVLA